MSIFSRHTKPAAPAPPTSLRPIAVVIPGRPGLTVRLEAPHGQFRGVTDGGGYLCFPFVPSDMRAANFFIDDPTSEFYGIVIGQGTAWPLALAPDGPTQGAHQLVIGAARPDLLPPLNIQLPPLVPLNFTLPRLRAEGQHFRQADSGRITIIEATDFQLFQRFLNHEDIEPILTERQALGFNTLRVLSTCDFMFRLYPQEHPDYYTQLIPFAQQLARHKLYLELTVFADATRVFLNQAEQLQHWNAVVNMLRSHVLLNMLRSNVLLELVNENDQIINAIQTDAFPRPIGLLASHGSNGSEAQPVLPHWDYATFHTNDASEWWRKVGHNAFEIWDGPTLANENTRAPDRFSSPTQAFDAAAGAALLCAGSCFHSASGKRSVLFSAQEYGLAEAWAAGARSVPLTCQDGPYRHRDDLEGSTDLRVYQRGDDPACMVHIRR